VTAALTAALTAAVTAAPPVLFDAYHDEWPLDPSYEQRRPALQLHKLLNNVRHFGSRWVPPIEAVLETYGW